MEHQQDAVKNKYSVQTKLFFFCDCLKYTMSHEELRKKYCCHQMQMLEFAINNDTVLVCSYHLRYLTFTTPSEDTLKPLV